jgi:RNA recognition motif-containing protein
MTTQTETQQQQQQPQSGKRIIVKNLPPGISKEELKELGDRHGRVINVELVPKPQHGKPFGFISYLSEEDAEFSLYRLSGFMYKNFQLEVAFSNAKPAPKPGLKGPAGQNNKQNPVQQKKKKPMYSLRTLTPLNPPTHPQQGYSPPQQPKAWDNAPGPAVPTPANNNIQPVDDGFIPANDKGNKGNQGKGPRRNNNNRSKGKQSYKQATPNEEVIEEDEQLSLESMPPQDSPVSVTDVQIIISPEQYWTLKLGPDQLDAFLKAVNPFLQFTEFH